MGGGGKRTPAVEVRRQLTALRKRLQGWSAADLAGLLKGGGSSSKGSSFEREVCKQLGLWWTQGERDDIFWRSSASGARATQRAKQGRATAGQHGDVAATDPTGAPLIRAFAVELKRGYNSNTIHDCLDAPTQAAQLYTQFFAQAQAAQVASGAYSWLLITRRDRRLAYCWHPYTAYLDLGHHGAWPTRPATMARIRLQRRYTGKGSTGLDLCAMPLEDWLAGVPPAAVHRLAAAAT